MNAPVKQPAQGREAPADGRDPDAKVPRAVREAAARSAEIMRQVAEGNAPPADPNTPPAQPPAEPQPTITITDAPPVTPPAPPQPPAEPQPQLTGDAAKWKNDFDAMKGRFEPSERHRDAQCRPAAGGDPARASGVEPDHPAGACRVRRRVPRAHWQARQGDRRAADRGPEAPDRTAVKGRDRAGDCDCQDRA
jgi:hypothetical protein